MSPARTGGADPIVDRDALAPDQARLQQDLEELAAFTDPAAPGWTRRVFSEPYQASREWIRARMDAAGLAVESDGAGNLIGRLPGTADHAPWLATGSHTDTVQGGGRFDGIVGVLGAIEVVRRLQETGTRLRHPLRVVDFLGEEPNEHGSSCLGSRAIAGALPAELLELRDQQHRPLGKVMASVGIDPDSALAAAWNPADVAAFVELHVEQGPVLERHGLEIGVVTAIAGIERVLANFVGRPDHAGTTPMGDRRDALLAAAAAVLAVERVGCGGTDSGAVATTGRLDIAPNAINVVPGQTRMWSELRSVDPAWLRGARRDLTEEILRAADQRHVEVEVDWLTDQDPVPVTPDIADVVANAAESCGRSWRALPSGAGHDAAHMAALGPMGMIFVPSRGGRSHCAEEWTDISAIAAGVHVLAATLVELDQR